MKELEKKIRQALREKEIKLIPNNIRQGIEIFGIEGSMPTGTGDVFLYTSVEQMEASLDHEVGDLATIYKTGNNWTASTEDSKVYFPENVTLPSAYTSSVNYNFYLINPTTETIVDQGIIVLYSNLFGMVSQMMTYDMRAYYTSNDGIHYTFDHIQVPLGNVWDLQGNKLVIDMPTWDPNFGYFLNTMPFFDGLYKYNGSTWAHIGEGLRGTTINVTPSGSIQTLIPQDPNNAYTKVTVDKVTAAVDPNIIPENIALDKTILNVKGTYNKHYIQIPQSIQNITYSSTSTYKFTLQSDGYYKSGNAGVSSSYSYLKISFTCPVAGLNLYLDCINNAENNYDYGLVSNLDQTLAQSSSADSGVKQSFKGKASTSVQTVSFTNISAGSHFITVKFIKDGSVNTSPDCLRIKVRTTSGGLAKGDAILSYNSIADMQADTTQEEGTYANIYDTSADKISKIYRFEGGTWVNVTPGEPIDTPEYNTCLSISQEILQ